MYKLFQWKFISSDQISFVIICSFREKERVLHTEHIKMKIKSGQRKRSTEDQNTNISYRYRVKQGRESEEHDGHDDVDHVADGEDYQEGVKLPLELLAAEHKNGNEISRNPKNSHTRLYEYYQDISCMFIKL